MDFLVFLGPAILIATVPIAGAIFILWLIWRLKRFGPYLCVALVGGIAYVVLSAVFPTDDFYLDDLSYLTGIEFPRENVVVVSGESTFPDMQGDYYLRAVYLVSGFDFASAARSARVPEQKSCGPQGEDSKLLREEAATESEAICWFSDAPWGKNYYLVFYPKDGRLELTHMP